MIVVMAAISVDSSEWGWRNKPTQTFILATRMGIVCWLNSSFCCFKNGVFKKNNLLSLIGLAAIAFSIFYFDETTPFPSVYALLPVLGVVLLVLYAEKETFKWLSTKALVGIGLISYSTYLWHQPLFAFARIRSTEHPSYLLMLVLAAISMILGYFSWRYVERPFRSGQISKKFIITASIAGLTIFALVGVLLNYASFNIHPLGKL